MSAARRSLAAVVVAVALAAPAAAMAAAPATPSAPAATRVSYLAGGSVYIEAGTLDGIAEGDTLAVLRDGARLGRLIVRYVSSHRASCDTLGVTELPRVGDAVRFTPRAAAPDLLTSGAAADSGAVSPAAPAAAPRARAARPFRGRIGGSYLRVSPQGGGGYAQPALDVRLDAALGAGDLAADVRSRRLYPSGSGTVSGVGRVYRMSFTIHDDDASRRLSLGRQTAPALSAVSLFDGLLASLAGRRWGAGVFAGSLPDPVRFRLSGDQVEGGAYLELRSAPAAARRWSLVSGGIAAYDHGNVDRDFLYLQASYADPRVWASLAQEVDLYSGWKRALGEPLLSPSSTFLSARARVTRVLTLDAGYDTRRNVRLYRDRVTPETEFDDRYRSGAWFGASVEPGARLRLGADARLGGGGAGGNDHAWTVSGELMRLPVLASDLRLRTTWFTGARSTEWLGSAGLVVRPPGPVQLGVNGGLRSSRDALSAAETRVTWQGADLSLGLARNWFATVSGERDQGGGSDDMQVYSALSWLF